MRVVVSSGERLFLDGVIAVLESDPNINVVSSAATVKECLSGVNLDETSVVLVDTKDAADRDLDFLAGAQIFGRFKTVFISSGGGVRELEGIALTRNASGADLLKAVREASGEPEPVAVAGSRAGGHESSQHPRTMADRPRRGRPPKPKPTVDESGAPRKRGRPRSYTNSFPLSSREYQAAVMISRGLSNKDMARLLNLKEQSVKNLVTTIARKLSCENRVQVAQKIAAASG